MKVLITGGFGYLGGRLSQFLAQQKNCEISLGSRLQNQPPTWLPQANVVQTKWDSSHALETICSNIDVIIHLAGMNAQDCTDNPTLALDFNALATDKLVKAAIQKNVKRFIYLSTAHVYGAQLIGDISEKTVTTATHPYATSHLAGERSISEAHKNKKIEGVVIRLSNAFGAPVHKNVNCWMLLVNDLCRQAVTNKTMVLKSSGLQRRDFITLTDFCRAIKHLIELPSNNLSDGLFNVGGAWSPTILEMTERLAECFNAHTNEIAEIKHETRSENEKVEVFKFDIVKLLSTGFNLSHPDIIDQELDCLIRFCFKNFSVTH